MSHQCCYCQKPFSRAGSRGHHERYTCWKRLENWQDKLPLVDFPLSSATSRGNSSKITLPTEKQDKFPNGIEFGEAFRFKTPSSILVVGPSGCGKTCFIELLLLDHLEEFFLSPPSAIHYLYGVWQDGFQDMKDAGVQFNEGIPETNHLKSWFPKGGLLVLDDLMVEGGEDKESLDLFTKHSHHQNITLLYLCQDMFPPGKSAMSISRNAHYIVAFKNPRDQLGMRNLLFQAFPTCWQDMMDVYQKSDLATRRERQLTTARAVKIPARNWVDYAVAFWLNCDLAKRYEVATAAHVLERFIRCSFTFPRLLIDNKQARCFSFEFRPFDLSPRK